MDKPIYPVDYWEIQVTAPNGLSHTIRTDKMLLDRVASPIAMLEREAGSLIHGLWAQRNEQRPDPGVDESAGHETWGPTQ